jgi:hypothetical protein
VHLSYNVQCTAKVVHPVFISCVWKYGSTEVPTEENTNQSTNNNSKKSSGPTKYQNKFRQKTDIEWDGFGIDVTCPGDRLDLTSGDGVLLKEVDSKARSRLSGCYVRV